MRKLFLFAMPISLLTVISLGAQAKLLSQGPDCGELRVESTYESRMPYPFSVYAEFNNQEAQKAGTLVRMIQISLDESFQNPQFVYSTPNGGVGVQVSQTSLRNIGPYQQTREGWTNYTPWLKDMAFIKNQNGRDYFIIRIAYSLPTISPGSDKFLVRRKEEFEFSLKASSSRGHLEATCSQVRGTP